MKTKLNLKILILVSILLILMCLFNTNMVQATDVTADETQTITETTPTTTDTPTTTSETAQTTAITDPQEILKLIPDTINVDILESQIFGSDEAYDNATLVEEQINSIIKNNNIDLEKMGIDCYTDLSKNTLDEGIIRKCKVELSDKTTYKTLAEKEINIKYKNSDNYNTTDEQYVQNKLKNIDFNLFVAEEIRQKDPNSYYKVVEENAKKLINDNSLTVIAKDNAAAGSDVSIISFNAYVYKNDILYAVKPFEYVEGTMILIPDNIQDTDEAYINYALPKIKEYWSYYTVKGVTKMTGAIRQDYDMFSMNIKNDGTFYKISLNDDDWARVVLKKANTTKVVDHIAISNNSGVTLNATNIDKNNSIYTEMLNRAKSKGYSNVFGVYELKLASGSIKEGLTITFSLGTENNGKQVIVLHKKADGTYEEFEKTITDGKIAVTVSEVSPFMVAIKDASSSGVDSEKDNTPNMGVPENFVVVATFLTVISAGAVVSIKRMK